ncbi:MAG: amidohydrolase [Flavobacteriales bacterium]|nr:amidohydrolase [Crocinitomicaceae bacterium]NBX80006.1 amidohydrolase [Flavobacteriales bacterium]
MKLTHILFLIAIPFLGNSQYNRILLTNGFLHVGNGETKESAAVGCVNGKITLIKHSLTTTFKKEDWDTIIDLNGKHIYPGFVAPNSTLGLTEIDAVRATRDYDDVGEYNSHVRTQIAFNAESKVIETVRTNGVLLAQPTPRGGTISGTSSVMFLSGWNWEDATVLKDDGIHLNWPSSTEGGGWWAEPAPKKRNENYEVQKREISEFFKLALAYSEAKRPKEDLRLEAMKECFNGKKRVFFHADDMQQLLDIIDFSKEFDLKFPVIVGGYDAHLLGRRLKDAGIPVMLTRTHSLPEYEEDAIDLPYKLPYLLKEQGIKFCLQNAGDMETMNARNLPFLAGTAKAYGLTEEEAIRSISLSTCEILGIDKNFGSIEIGKSATLFVSDGSALDMRTNQVSVILVDGKLVSSSNFQTELYRKYKNKYAKKSK